MVQGCYDAWQDQINQFLLIGTVTAEAPHTLAFLAGIGWILHFRDITFVYITVLEFLYPQLAYCIQGTYDIGTAFDRYVAFVEKHPF